MLDSVCIYRKEVWSTRSSSKESISKKTQVFFCHLSACRLFSWWASNLTKTKSALHLLDRTRALVFPPRPASLCLHLIGRLRSHDSRAAVRPAVSQLPCARFQLSAAAQNQRKISTKVPRATVRVRGRPGRVLNLLIGMIFNIYRGSRVAGATHRRFS